MSETITNIGGFKRQMTQFSKQGFRFKSYRKKKGWEEKLIKSY